MAMLHFAFLYISLLTRPGHSLNWRSPSGENNNQDPVFCLLLLPPQRQGGVTVIERSFPREIRIWETKAAERQRKVSSYCVARGSGIEEDTKVPFGRLLSRRLAGENMSKDRVCFVWECKVAAWVRRLRTGLFALCK